MPSIEHASHKDNQSCRLDRSIEAPESPRSKAREVTREIQGLPVAAALDVVAFSPKKAASLVAKTLKSAIANAENNANLRVEKLVVQEATVAKDRR
jgi:ribosomal protein L22